MNFCFVGGVAKKIKRIKTRLAERMPALGPVHTHALAPVLSPGKIFTYISNAPFSHAVRKIALTPRYATPRGRARARRSPEFIFDNRNGHGVALFLFRPFADSPRTVIIAVIMVFRQFGEKFLQSIGRYRPFGRGNRC